MTPKRPTRGARKPRRSTRPHKLADTRRSGDHGAKPAVPRPTKPRTGLQKRRAEQIAEMEDVVRQIAGVRTSDVAQHLVGQLSKLQPWDNQRSDAERWSAAVTMLAEIRPASGGANELTMPIRKGLITKEHIHAEVGELVSGTRTGRTSSEQITLYKSVGVAVQDAVAASLVLAAAREQGAGVEIEL